METQPTNEDLEKVINQVKNSNENRFQLWSIKDIVERDFGKDRWTVQGLVPYEGITIITGEPSSFKSWITLEMAKCVSLGKPFLGKFKTTQGAVIMVDEENHPRYVKDRINMLSIPYDANIFYLSMRRIKVDAEGETDRLLEVVKSVNAKLIVFDPLVRVHSKNENDSGGMAFVFEQFKRFTMEGVAVITTHHNRKTTGKGSALQNTRGSTDIPAAIDSMLAVEKNGKEILVGQCKARTDELLKPFTILSEVVSGKMILEYGGIMGQLKTKKDKAEAVILELLRSEELTREDIGRKLKELEDKKQIEHIGDNSVGKALDSLEEKEMVKIRRTNAGTKHYSLAKMENDDDDSREQEQASTINENNLWQPELGIGQYANEKDEPF